MTVNALRLVSLGVKALENFRGSLPAYQSEQASGFDVCACLPAPVVLEPGARAVIPTGLSFEVPFGYELQARPRSGLALKFGISLVNTPGTIDSDYRGEVKILLINHGDAPFVVKDQERIAQLVLAPVVQAKFHWVESLTQTERGAGGFGSTGI